MGLWRIPVGDIAAAYSGQTFPIIKTFRNGNAFFTNCGCAFSEGPVQAAVDAYPLLSLNISPKPLEKQYSYEGREAKFKGQKYLLGPKIIFESSEPTVSEWRGLLRILYVEGGYFASQNTYAEFLARYQKHDGNLAQAVVLETGHEIRMFTKEKLSAFLTAEPKTLPPGQLEFSL